MKTMFAISVKTREDQACLVDERYTFNNLISAMLRTLETAVDVDWESYSATSVADFANCAGRLEILHTILQPEDAAEYTMVHADVRKHCIHFPTSLNLYSFLSVLSSVIGCAQDHIVAADLEDTRVLEDIKLSETDIRIQPEFTYDQWFYIFEVWRDFLNSIYKDVELTLDKQLTM